MRAVTALISAVTAAVVTAAVSQMAGAVTTTKKAENPAAWDVVLILTDDQPTGTLPSMPNVTRLLAGRGVDFTNAIVPTSLCCPSRTSLLTGQLATKTGIYSNESDTGYGGYPALRAAGLEKQTIATALDEAGYNTAYFGKYLNEYGPLYDGVAPPAGTPGGSSPPSRAAGTATSPSPMPCPSVRPREPLARSSCASTRPRTWAVWPPITSGPHRVISHRSQCSHPTPPIRPSPPRRSTAARADCRPTT